MMLSTSVHDSQVNACAQSRLILYRAISIRSGNSLVSHPLPARVLNYDVALPLSFVPMTSII